MLRYVLVFNIQIAATSVSNSNSKLEERLAHWLLMVADRVGRSFSITHTFLATMLAVRRSGVTIALKDSRAVA
ncbi:MAG: helix-turn-helix domain-containing protein [Candidatus Devosia symbiotica]|nr:helix-turn-helix domain-containing protein [Candidatus Devosia symbiotica]